MKVYVGISILQSPPIGDSGFHSLDEDFALAKTEILLTKILKIGAENHK
jgi:hypothetical protein